MRWFSKLLVAAWLLTSAARGDQIHQAVREGRVEVVQEILAQDASLVNTRDDSGLLPLHLAAAHGHTNIVALLLLAALAHTGA